MSVYYYGNVDGQYRAFGDRSAEQFTRLFEQLPTALFCRYEGNCYAVLAQAQQRASAPSRFVQAECGPWRHGNLGFLWVEFEDEQTVLNRIREGLQQSLQEMAPIPTEDGRNEQLKKLMLYKLAEGFYYGGSSPVFILDASDQPFMLQVRYLAQAIFGHLPAAMTGSMGVCTNPVTPSGLLRLVELLPSERGKHGAISASDCAEALKGVRPKVRKLVDFWFENPELVNRFGAQTASIKDWDVIADLCKMDINGITAENCPTFAKYYTAREGRCWKQYIMEIAQRHIEEIQAARGGGATQQRANTQSGTQPTVVQQRAAVQPSNQTALTQRGAMQVGTRSTAVQQRSDAQYDNRTVGQPLSATGKANTPTTRTLKAHRTGNVQVGATEARLDATVIQQRQRLSNVRSSSSVRIEKMGEAQKNTANDQQLIMQLRQDKQQLIQDKKQMRHEKSQLKREKRKLKSKLLCWRIAAVLLVIIFGVSVILQQVRVSQLEKALSAYRTGSVVELENLAEHYKPAALILNQLETAVSNGNE